MLKLRTIPSIITTTFGSWNPLVLRFASCARAKASAREENSNADLGSRSWNFMPCLLPTKPDVRESVQNFNAHRNVEHMFEGDSCEVVNMNITNIKLLCWDLESCASLSNMMCNPKQSWDDFSMCSWRSFRCNVQLYFNESKGITL